MGRPILERERERAELRAAVREAGDGVGSVALISGEAGIGKSSLVETLPTVLPDDARLLIGYCDDLATRRVFGPLRDLVDAVGPSLARALEAGDRSRVLDELRAELATGPGPTVLVVEDIHWADEATLDVLRFLVRRVAAMPVLLVLTYRDDELARDHPLRHLLGLISRTARVRRMPLAPLSAGAVRRLGADTDLDPDRVYQVTSGNPFFVAEILAAGDTDVVPSTVAEAVEARLAALDPTTRDALEVLAVVPSSVERWLVDLVVPHGLPALAAAERHGVLVVGEDRVTFRHELTRRSIVDSMPAVRRLACNRSVLGALLDPHRGVDVSRIVHHAAEAGEADLVVRYGRAAAREAVAAGSHAEAVAHYRRVVAHAGELPPAERAEVLEGYAVECYTTGDGAAASAAQRRAVDIFRDLGDAGRLGLALRWLSRMHWWAGDRPASEAAGAEAASVLADAGDRRAWAMALSNQAQLLMLAGRWADSLEYGRPAADAARELGDAAVLSHALTNNGSSLWEADPAEAERALAEALAVALAADEIEHACRAYAVLTWHLLDALRVDEAGRAVADGVELADRHEFLGFLLYLRTQQGEVALARADWERADRLAEWAVDGPPTTSCPALVVRGRVRARRGTPGAYEMLAEAWTQAERLDEAQRTGPAGAALVEAGWLTGRSEAAVAAVLPWYERIRRYGSAGCRAEVGYWLRRAGAPVEPEASSHPYALLAAGRWPDAARAWAAAGCRYEHALALIDSDDPSDVLTALATLDDLGAEPLAAHARRRLRALGVAGVPRGPAPSTRDNPGRLTGRQVEVVRLLAGGLTNAAIAARLVLSVRTVDAHVAAVLDKLDVSTRAEAVARARELGLLGDGEPAGKVGGRPPP